MKLFKYFQKRKAKAELRKYAHSAYEQIMNRIEQLSDNPDNGAAIAELVGIGTMIVMADSKEKVDMWLAKKLSYPVF